MSYQLDLQLFGEKGKSGVIDADAELDKMGEAKNVDKETDDDIDEEDIVDDEDEEEEEDSDDDAEDGDDSEEDDDSTDDDDADKKSDKDDSKAKEETKTDTKTEESKSPSDKKPQSRDVNHEQKLIRQQKEAEEKARKENFTKGFIAALGGVNPYTKEKIVTEDDIHEAQVMIEAKNRGLDPITDFHKMDKILRGEEREKIAKEAEQAQKEEQARKKDFEEFGTKYPDVDVAKLFNEDKDFIEFASDLVGNIPLTTIYEKYQKYQTKAANTAADKNDMKEARKVSTPGSVSSGGDSNSDYYTMDELKKMTPDEVKQNWKKVEASYAFHSRKGKSSK